MNKEFLLYVWVGISETWKFTFLHPYLEHLMNPENICASGFNHGSLGKLLDLSVPQFSHIK